ncbi:GNAT family N-acetyltransferase [Terribacillus sp. DMT04]|uniref:GNAT family N-acetyltransferase n=1 Tax=Terribacillus sp. DMT04 TaxID=2850441 RepID=UPI001C2CB95B|nr:GNAT family N-acetyltransferase [Terribacillus sp. DMT04]QXE02444.1 GNAT family N-acetyltransferase [Terribacillus sp. DMT04]
MTIELQKATMADAEEIHACQVAAFQPLLFKYQDTDSNPANEPLARTITRINRTDGGFYKIMKDNKVFVGAICLFTKEPGIYWISPMFVYPSFQGKGYAQETLKQVEIIFADAKAWRLATIEEEQGNCYLYEKAGYQRTGKSQVLNARATLVYYEKRM